MTDLETILRTQGNVIDFKKPAKRAADFMVAVGIGAGIAAAVAFIISVGWAWICALFSL